MMNSESGQLIKPELESSEAGNEDAFFALRPNEHINALIDALMPYGKGKVYAKRTKLRLNNAAERSCCLLLSGIVSVRRSSDSLTIGCTAAPSVLGIAEILFPLDLMYLYFETEGEVFLLPESVVMDRLNGDNLWRHLTYLQSFMIQYYCFHESILVGRTSYEIIRIHLQMLMREPEDIRKKISASNYIIDRTLLSRSSTMRILQELRQGGYIVIEWGKLVKINNLPFTY
jgi:hypothetical protein